MSKLARDAEAIEQCRVDEPAEPLAHDERLRIAQRIVQAMHAGGIDCELAKAPSDCLRIAWLGHRAARDGMRAL